ncbi:hypothetical protein NC653_018270 [Populus alba x Populus x berolinensis]|uniref:Rhodopsin n=1 Tax=Populus alba x Populus x berolinensis TaxID=444605 RepID=A0AAD6QG51_9ROSI|nr:hypothetical protein NC653_018270 [Populus alba x Populus x berolinensis]
MSYYNQQHAPVGAPPPQGYPKDAYPPPGHPAQGYPPQGYPPPQGYAPQYGAAPPPKKQTGLLEGWYVSLSFFSIKESAWQRSVAAAFWMLASDEDSGVCCDHLFIDSSGFRS